MSHSSIFDLLHQRQPSDEPKERFRPGRADYDPGRLRLIDGVALTAAGLVSAGSVPEAHVPELSSSLCGPDGFRLLVHEIADLSVAAEPRLARIDARALRLHQLVQSVIADALMMLESLPEEGYFDVVLSAPVSSPDATAIIKEHLQATIEETRHRDWLGSIRHSQQGEDPHATLVVAEDSGMAYVLWISADSFVNDQDTSPAQHQNLLMQNSRGEGLFPGEAVAALLVQRLQAEETTFDSGWMIGQGELHEHPPRAARRDHAKRQALIQLFNEFWPESEAGQTPSCLVIDTVGLPGRAVELGGAVIERWPEIDTIDDSIGVDAFCGWVGEAMSALMLVLAIAKLKPTEHAVVLGLHAESYTRIWALRGLAGETTHAGEAHS